MTQIADPKRCPLCNEIVIEQRPDGSYVIRHKEGCLLSVNAPPFSPPSAPRGSR